ncbi:MAG: C1 family peptidase [Verrucomicrobiales bacterium]
MACRKVVVENSWGSKVGNDGVWTMLNDWFDENVYRSLSIALMSLLTSSQRSTSPPSLYPRGIRERPESPETS